MRIARDKPLLRRSDAMILTSAFEGVDVLLQGVRRLDPQSFHNLSTIVEAAVLHPRLMVIGPRPRDHWRDRTSKDAEPGKESMLYARLRDRVFVECLSRDDISPEDELSQDIFNAHMDGNLMYMAGGVIPCVSCDFLLPQVPHLYWIRLMTRVADMGELPESLSADDRGKFPAMVDHFRRVSEIPRQVYGNALELPFMLRFGKQASVPVSLYARLADVFKVKTGQLRKHLGLKVLDIPPLMAILLSRCKSREDIPDEILKLREEFSDLRSTNQKYESALAGAQTLGDKLQILDELDEMWTLLLRKLAKETKHTKLLLRAWDIVKPGSLVPITTKSLDLLLEQGLEKQMLERVGAYFHLWKAALDIKDYEALIDDVFGEEFDAHVYAEYRNYAAKVERYASGLGSRALTVSEAWPNNRVHLTAVPLRFTAASDPSVRRGLPSADWKFP